MYALDCIEQKANHSTRRAWWGTRRAEASLGRHLHLRCIVLVRGTSGITCPH